MCDVQDKVKWDIYIYLASLISLSLSAHMHLHTCAHTHTLGQVTLDITIINITLFNKFQLFPLSKKTISSMKIKLNSECQQIEKKFSMHVCGEYREHVTNNENFKILIFKKKSY